MKQIPLLQGKALLIELPDGTHHWRMDYYISNRLLYWPEGKGHADDSIAALLPPGNWRIIGMLSEVREMDAIPLVDKVRFIVDGPDLGFRNYKGNKYDWFGTALESLESSILAEGYSFAPSMSEIYDSESQCMRIVESRVLDRSRCLLLGRVDG